MVQNGSDLLKLWLRNCIGEANFNIKVYDESKEIY